MSENLFTENVDEYDKYRLPYNFDAISETIKYISNVIKIDTVAYIGAGTGILTHQLLKYKFNKYYTVDPNIKMQECSINKDKKSNPIYDKFVNDVKLIYNKYKQDNDLTLLNKIK